MTSRGRLFLVSIAIVVIWQLPHGQQALYPLSLLATYAHELGHGLTALLVGADFERLVLYADGSGMATWRGDPGRLAIALIAAGGLVGPSVAGCILLLLAHWPRLVRLALGLLAGLVAISAMLWLRNTFGMFFVLATAALLGLAARYLAHGGAAFLLQFVAATLCLSWFSQLDYMFSAQASVAGVVGASDSAVIGAALGLPYWLCGALVAAVSLALALLGVWVTSRWQPDFPAQAPG